MIFLLFRNAPEAILGKYPEIEASWKNIPSGQTSVKIEGAPEEGRRSKCDLCDLLLLASWSLENQKTKSYLNFNLKNDTDKTDFVIGKTLIYKLWITTNSLKISSSLTVTELVIYYNIKIIFNSSTRWVRYRTFWRERSSNIFTL